MLSRGKVFNRETLPSACRAVFTLPPETKSPHEFAVPPSGYQNAAETENADIPAADIDDGGARVHADAADDIVIPIAIRAAVADRVQCLQTTQKWWFFTPGTAWSPADPITPWS